MHRNATRLMMALAVQFAWGTPEASVVPPGFSDEVVVGGSPACTLVNPTAVRFHPITNELWITEKGIGVPSGSASVLMLRSAKRQLIPALTLPCVGSTGERGLTDLAFDPDFAANHFVYLFYSHVDDGSATCLEPGSSRGARNVVVRFRMAKGRLVDPMVILEVPLIEMQDSHNGGSLKFLPDGTLLVSTGDNGIDPLINQVSRDLTDLRGKILRINTDGTVPADNPFVNAAAVRPEIWASGFRNPFRFSVNPLSGAVFLTDVGQATYEEIDLGRSGADYGWPCFEARAGYAICDPAPALAALTFPIFDYGHNGLATPVVGEAIVGGPVYTQTAFPGAYRGNYFFADFVEGWINHARLGPGDVFESVETFLTGAAGPVDLEVGPDGCLYYVAFLANEVHRVCYSGGPGIRPRPWPKWRPPSCGRP